MAFPSTLSLSLSLLLSALSFSRPLSLSLNLALALALSVAFLFPVRSLPSCPWHRRRHLASLAASPHTFADFEVRDIFLRSKTTSRSFSKPCSPLSP
eukprot:1408692-Pleurochrysis_carterae.AAC.3